MHNAIYKEWTDKTGKPLDLSETDPRKNPILLPDVIDAVTISLVDISVW